MIIKHLKDLAQGKAQKGQLRSTKWASIRKKFLESNGKCAVCGGIKKLEVHHKKPFNQNPELELDVDNLITLCESKKNGVTCHLLFGHLGNYKSINKNIDQDVKEWNNKIRNRPYR